MPSREIRRHISLAGEWKFRIDSLDTGIRDHWYGDELEGAIVLPGSMAENGLGDEVTLSTPWTGSISDSSYFKEDSYERYRQPDNLKIPFWLKPVKYYAGAAWYQREVVIPGNWEGKRVILTLERCHWESHVFINDREAGTGNSLSTHHQYDITSLLKSGNNRISIRIDNRIILPVGVNSHSVSDHTQTNWNGIIGEISLTAHSPVYTKSIRIHPDIHAKSARILLAIANSSGEPFEGKVDLQAASFNTENAHTPKEISRSISIPGKGKTIEIIYPMGEECLLWNEFTPSLYSLEVGLTGSNGELVDRFSESFGMREFTSEGTRFAINDHPVYLRGTL
jgi:beta-galactosidase/beta-glucuronidase